MLSSPPSKLRHLSPALLSASEVVGPGISLAHYHIGVLWLSLILGILGALPTPSAAALDEVHLRLLRHYDLALRWDNVEDAPQWVSGSKPAYQRRWGMHLVSLTPGQQVTVRIAPGQWLRVHHPTAALALDDLDIAVSNGSGLYASVPVQQGSDGRTLLLTSPTVEPLVARITRSGQQRQGLAVALFVSRRDPLAEIAPYRGLLSLQTPAVRLRQGDPTETQTFWRLAPDLPASLSVTGPTRLALPHRLAYAPTESRMLQTYQIRTSLDGVISHVLEFFTQVDTTEPVYLNGRAVVMSRLEVGYLDIPPGTHTLQLHPTAVLYGRLLEQQRPDYLVPAINQPAESAAAIQHAGLPALLALPAWAIDDAQVQEVVGRQASSAAERERVAFRLVRDNRHREGGLLGAMLMHDAARQQPADPRIHTVAERLLGAHTFFRDLFPSHKASPEPQELGWFIPRRLYTLGERRQRSLASMQHLEEYLGRIAAAYFVKVPTAPEINLYHLPQQAAPTLLRVAIDASNVAPGQSIMLQLGEAPPIPLSLSASPEFPPTDYATAQADIGLAMLHWQYPAQDTSTSGGPFSRSHVPAPLLSAATFEFLVPPAVRTVRLWQPSSPSGSVRLALQYRAAKPYRLSESTYLETVQSLGPPSKLFQHFANLLDSSPGPEPAEAGSDVAQDAASELANHWWPLRRFLASRARVFTTAVAAPLAPFSGPSLPLSQVEVLRQQAQRESAAGQWLVALEKWSSLAHGTTDAVYREAQLGRVTALQYLGEAFLAEHLLRGMLLHEADSALRTQALARLEELYRSAGDLEALQALYAAMALRQPQPEILRALMLTLLEDGQHELALTLGLLLPKSTQPLSALLQATYHLRWWHTFHTLLERLESPAEQHYWQGYQAQAMGQTETARQHWRQAGAAGRAVLTALEKALAIQHELQTPDAARREQAIVAWEQWQAEHPGAQVWHPAPELVADYAGAETLYSVERDVFAQAFKGTPGKPVKLRLWGPLQLRVEARLLHPQGAVDELDSWLQVRYGEQLQILPMTNDRPVQGLDLVTDHAWVPGRKFTGDYTLGPGWHNVTIAAEHIPVLVQVAVKRPDMSLGVVPWLTPHTLLTALQSQPQAATETEKPGRFCQDCLLLVAPTQDAVPLSRPLAWPQFPATLSTAQWQGQLAELQERLETWREPAAVPASFSTLAARYLSQDNLQAAFALPLGGTDEDVLQRLALVVWWAEHSPEHYAQALALGEALAEAHPLVPGVAALQNRLVRASTWKPLSSVQSSAGQRYIALRGWQPESQALRIRKALLAPFGPAEQVLSGFGRMTVSMQNVEPASLLVEGSIADMPYLPPLPLTMQYQVDEQPLQRLTLSASQPQQSLQLAIPTGRHTLRFRIEQPLANQFLRLRLVERKDASQEPLLPEIERPYHVATPQEPIRLHIAGPAWLRLDTLRDDTTVTTYRLLTPGWHSLALAPDTGEQLLRLHRRIVAPEQETTPTRYVPATLEPVPTPLVQVDGPALPAYVTLHDAYPLGAQEDGTWTLNSSFVRRRNVQEDASQPAPEQFWEQGGTYRYFDAYRHLYYETAGLGRWRTDGGPTLGLRERVIFQPQSVPFTFSLLGSAFVQLPLNDTTTEWAGALRGTVSYQRAITPKTAHRPALSLFGRLLSLERQAANVAGQVDQDVFTPYKAQHTAGLELADTLTHRPWLDTLWWTGVSLVSNEDFNVLQPDHLTLRLGWKQLLGDLQINAAYRFSHYFADDQRSRGLNRNTLTLDLTWEHWWRQQQRLEADLRLQYDPDFRESSVSLTLSWHLGRGRGYRDFWPGDVNFAAIRHRRIPQQPNNLIR